MEMLKYPELQQNFEVDLITQRNFNKAPTIMSEYRKLEKRLKNAKER